MIVQIAARAIISHHDKRSRAILSDPLATLLAVADRMQMWRRPFLHREQPRDPRVAASFRTVIECERLALCSEGDGYLARFQMTQNEDDRRILKADYDWNFQKFANPNRVVERLIERSGWLPRIILSQRRCIEPPGFLAFMKKK